MNPPQEALRKMARPSNKVLASEVASTSTDPRYYSAMNVLPNPDPVLRKLGMQQDVYEAIAYDAHVLGELRSIRGELLKNEWRIMPGGDQPKEVEVFELVKKIFDQQPAVNLSWSDIIWNMQCAVFRGFSVTEVEWKKEGDLIVPARLSDKPQRRFCFDYDHELRVLTKNNQTYGEEIPSFKMLLARHMPSHDNPHGLAVFSALFWPYTFKHNGYRWFAKFLERYGIPSPIGRYPIGTPLEQQQDLLGNLKQMIEDAVAVVPEGTGVELLETKGSGQAMHESFLNFCNREMSKALTSQTLGSEVTESGSRSTAEVQANRQGGNAEADREMVQRAMQTLCDWITQLNFGKDVIAPKWEFYDEKQVSKDEVETLEIASRIVPVKSDEIYDRLQLTKPEDGDDVIYNGNQPGDGTQLPPADSQFHSNDCIHQFEQEDLDRITELAAAGNKAAQAQIEEMTATIRDLAESAEDLDDLDDQLASILDDINSSDYQKTLEDGIVIANGMGLEDGK